MTTMQTSRDIAAHLRRQIHSGLLRPGDQIPTGNELRNRYGAAKQTIYAAIKILRDEGLVTTEPGIGCFVRDQVQRVRLVRRPVALSQRPGNGPIPQSFTSADADRWLADVHTTRNVVRADSYLAEELGVAEGAEIWFRSRTMSENGTVVALVVSYFSRLLTRGTVIEEEDTGDGGVFARLKDLGFVIDKHVERVISGLATEAEAAQLQPEGPELCSVLRITRLALGPDGHVLGSIHITALAERFELLYEIPGD